MANEEDPTPRPSAAPAKPAAKPVARVARPAAPAKPAKKEIRVHHLTEEEKGGIDKATKIGLMVAGGLAVIAAIVLMVVVNKKSAVEAERKAYEDMVAGFKNKIVNIKPDTDEATIEAAVKDVGEGKPKWINHPDAGQIDSALSRAKANLESGKEKRKVAAQLKEIEEKLKSDASLTTDSIKEMRRTLEEVATKMQSQGPEAVARVAIAQNTASRLYATHLVEDPKKAIAAGENARLLLVRCQAAEDELKPLVDEAYRDKNEELKSFYGGLYEQAIATTDQLVTKIFTPSEIDGLPWTDCLAGAQAGYWNPSSAKGFSHRVDKGALTIIGPDPEVTRQPILAIGDREQWRSFVADIEFTVSKGGFQIFFHLGKGASDQTPSKTWKADGDSPELRPDKTYRAKIAMIGSHLTITFAGSDNDIDLQGIGTDETLRWTKTRKGAIGLVIPPGARIKFTRFQVKELR